MSCPKNQTAVSGVDGALVNDVLVNGVKKECRCLEPFKMNGSVCEATEKRCAPDERFRGLKSDMSPDCQKVSCEIMNMNEGCRYGGWMEQLMVYENPATPLSTGCRGTVCFVEKNGSLCNAEVVCDGFVRCCYELADIEKDVPAYVPPPPVVEPALCEDPDLTSAQRCACDNGQNPNLSTQSIKDALWKVGYPKYTKYNQFYCCILMTDFSDPKSSGLTRCSCHVFKEPFKMDPYTYNGGGTQEGQTRGWTFSCD
jgi:hypothetical protein